MDIRKTALELCAIDAPSGSENEGFDKLIKAIGGYFDVTRPINSRNCLFTRKGVDESKTVLIDAHFDQIAFIITKIHENGEMSFSSLGGLDNRTLISSEVTILADKPIKGIIISEKDEHLPIKRKDLYIFADMTKGELESAGVKVGTRAVHEHDPITLGEKRFAVRSLDNRISAISGVYAIALFDEEGKKPPVNVALLCSSNEETNGAGVKTALNTIKPDIALVVDVDLARTPDTEASDTVEGGKGPSVSLSVQTDRKLTKKIISIAKEKEIPCQPALNPTRTGTNAEEVMYTNEGVPTAVIGIPLRNMHTMYEAVDEEDVKLTGELLKAIIESEGVK